jgi:pyruvate dehydrogenase E2 component (dihydrolipoamide acetyltransferase)
MTKVADLDMFVAQESEQAMNRALISLGTVTGRPVALPAPARSAGATLPAPANGGAAASNLDREQEDALNAIEGSSQRVSEPAPAPAPAPQPAPAAPAAAPAAPVQPAAPVTAQPAAAASDDAELDALLGSLQSGQ